jgi:hypothetical protein
VGGVAGPEDCPCRASKGSLSCVRCRTCDGDPRCAQHVQSLGFATPPPRPSPALRAGEGDYAGRPSCVNTALVGTAKLVPAPSTIPMNASSSSSRMRWNSG